MNVHELFILSLLQNMHIYTNISVFWEHVEIKSLT